MNAPTGNRIEVRLREIGQLFNSLDPSPFVDRDLDAAAEEFIVSWARELPSHGELELVIHLAAPAPADRAAGTGEAVRHYFASRAEIKRREFRLMVRRGRFALVVGLLFLAACFGLGEVVQPLLPATWGEFVELGLHIVGWVAMWRPLEIYLYDLWPVRSEVKLFERLARMEIRLNESAG